MPIPDFQEFMLPLLKIAANSEIKLSDAIDKIVEIFQLTEEERNELLPSRTQTIIANRVSWAKTYLVRAGLLVMTRRAYFKISERGLAALAEKPDKIDREFLDRYDKYREFRTRRPNERKTSQIENELTPEESVHDALERLEDSLCDEILSRIMSQRPGFFENLVVKLLIAMGYGGSVENAGKALGKTGDGGVDGVIDQDVLGLDRIYVQAKRYANGNNVGSGAIRDFFGSLDKFKASKGLFVTTSDFTSDAISTAKQLSKRIVLINGWQLVKLMVRYGVGCRIEETLYIKKLDEDFFEMQENI